MSYLIIESICQQLDNPVTAGEAHGMATALLCADERTDAMIWLTELLKDSSSVINDEEKETLLLLFEQTRDLISADDFRFDLLLPDDQQPLFDRAEAVKNWCRGFAYGIGLHPQTQELTGDSREIVKDIIEFSKLDSDVEDEEDDVALMEISEYIKVTVQLLKQELSS